MSAALRLDVPRTLEEFLAWERRQELRYEWDGVQPIAMVGGTFLHTELATRLSDVLRERLRGTGCTVVRADLKVLTAKDERARYPDLAVTCTPIPPSARAVPAPVLIVEVLSESTGAADLGIKRQEYAALPSLARYVILSNEERLALVFARARDFAAEEVREVLHLPEFEVSVSLASLYDGLLAG